MITKDRVTFDRASRRRFDENGFLHVAETPISKETVNEYYGSEIPGWQSLGLEPERIYRGYRPGNELAKAADTFNGLPLLKEHVKDSADDPQKELRVGNLGTSARFAAPYLYNALIIQDAESIDALAVKDGRPARRELSASYRYVPVFTPGVFKGQKYDFIMTDIRGNHVALVEQGRAGPDVVVADAAINPNPKRNHTMGFIDKFKGLLAELESGKGQPGDELETGALFANGEDNDPGCPDYLRLAGSAMDDEAADDLGKRLVAYLENMEDQELAASVWEVIEAALAFEAPAGSDNETLNGQAEDDEDEENTQGANGEEGEKSRPAMDGKMRGRSRRFGKNMARSRGFSLAMDAKAVAAMVRAGLKAQIEASRLVAPLIGEIDPLAFDSAARIYSRALELIGKPSRLTDARALKELCILARDAKSAKAPYPFITVPESRGSKTKADPAFAHLGSIRKA